MNTVIKPTLLAGLGVLSLSAIFGAGNSADAMDFKLSVNANKNVQAVLNINSDRHFVEGHYETRTEQVLVSPERKEMRVIPAVTETRRDYYGKPYSVLVTPERREEICIPAQYKTVNTKVWIPGTYANDNRGGFQDRDHDGRNDRYENDHGRIPDGRNTGPAFPDRDHDGRNDRTEDDHGRVPDTNNQGGFSGFFNRLFNR